MINGGDVLSDDANRFLYPSLIVFSCPYFNVRSPTLYGRTLYCLGFVSGYLLHCESVGVTATGHRCSRVLKNKIAMHLFSNG